MSRVATKRMGLIIRIRLVDRHDGGLQTKKRMSYCKMLHYQLLPRTCVQCYH